MQFHDQRSVSAMHNLPQLKAAAASSGAAHVCTLYTKPTLGLLSGYPCMPTPLAARASVSMRCSTLTSSHWKGGNAAPEPPGGTVSCGMLRVMWGTLLCGLNGAVLVQEGVAQHDGEPATGADLPAYIEPAPADAHAPELVRDQHWADPRQYRC